MRLSKRLPLLMGAAALVVMAFTQGVNPGEVMKQIAELRRARAQEAQASGKPLDAQALQAEIVEKAKEAVKGVDATKVDPKDGYAWAQLFQLAGDPKSVCDAASRFVSSNPEPSVKYSAQLMMMSACNSLGEGHMLAMMIGELSPPNPMSAISLASMTAGSFSRTIAKTEGVDAAIRALDRVEKLVPFDSFTTPTDKQRADATLAAIASAKYDLLTDAGRTAEAAKVIDDAIAKLGEGNAAARGLKGAKTRNAMLNMPAPALAVERTIGEFKGLESLKGKVVLVDFFAHWCGPCIRSFPDMKKMYEDLKPKGLEIIGFTTYYGYYKRENVEKRDMPRDVEFGKMSEFIAEHGLPWPVVYGERSNFDAYGVTGIPHVTVIDRKGLVRKIKIGYLPESFGAFRKEIEHLLSE